MIDRNHGLAFVMASPLSAVPPGPGGTNIVGYAITSGRRTAYSAMAGADAGNPAAMTPSLARMGTRRGADLLRSPTTSVRVRWASGGVLVFASLTAAING